MSDRALKMLVAVVISLLLIFQIGKIIAGAFGMVWALVSSIFVAAVSFVAARAARAGGRRSFWFLLPTLLFTLIPIGVTVWKILTSDTSRIAWVMSLTPLLVGFVLPIGLLLLIHYELRRRAEGFRNRERG